MAHHQRNIFEAFNEEGSDDDYDGYISDYDPEFRPQSANERDNSESESSDEPDQPSTSTSTCRKRRKTTQTRSKRQRIATQDGEIELVRDDGGDIGLDGVEDDSTSTETVSPPVGVANVNNADWTQSLEGFPFNPTFSGDAGIQFDDTDATVLTCFELFITPWLINHLKLETNRYAANMKANNPARLTAEGTNLLKEWKAVTLQEIQRFLLLLLHMGVVKKPSINDYWCGDIFINTPFAGLIMSRDRFKAILSMLHFNDNSRYVPIGDELHDPLFKVRPVYEHLQQRFEDAYVPTKNIAVDEAMCPWRGRLRFKVYLKDKPNPWGIKLYQLCESGSGYVFRFEIYAAQKDVSNKPTDVVLRLVDPLLDKGYHVFTDNYYSCPPLFNALVQRSTSCTGTVRANRVGMPKDLAVEKLSTGQISFRRKDNLCALKWSDKRDVMILTSAHTPTNTVETTSRNFAGVKTKPEAVTSYTKNMCGVDQSDQLMAYLPLNRRTLKWSKKVFVHLFTLSVVQAHIVYNKILAKNNKDRLPLPYFIKALGKQLTEKLIDGPLLSQTKPGMLLRLNHQHFHHLVSLPSTASKSRPRRECKVCRDVASSLPGATPRVKDVYHWCKVCKVPMCVEPCFFLFHNAKDYVAAAKA